MKQQMAAVYHDFSLRMSQWEGKEKLLMEQSHLLTVEKDDLKLQLKRTQELLEASADSGATGEQLVRLGTDMQTRTI